jgi:hypothetical protein
MPINTHPLIHTPAYLQNYYPFNYIMPTGDMFNYCGRTGRILVPESGVCVCV